MFNSANFRNSLPCETFSRGSFVTLISLIKDCKAYETKNFNMIALVIQVAVDPAPAFWKRRPITPQPTKTHADNITGKTINKHMEKVIGLQ